MGIRQNAIASGPGAARRVKKVQELSETHGIIVDEFVKCGRLPVREISNFYGRHAERREAILSAMQRGASYSRAYKESSGCFDTTRWTKIANRAAACRGHLLKTAAALVARGLSGGGEPGATEHIEAQALGIADEAVRLVQVVGQCDVEAAPSKPKRRKRQTAGYCSFGDCEVTPKRVASQLSTAVAKLKKNVRDVPQMLAKTGTAPTVADVARVAVEAARIINGVPLLIAALRSGGPTRVRTSKCSDPLGIGREYAGWLDALLPESRPMIRIATHRAPDADALVSTWLADRFLFAGEESRVEFVHRSYIPKETSTFSAVLDVGRAHDPKRLVFDHKPPAFSHRDEECATTLVWQHANSSGCQVEHLKDLAELVHDGDAKTRRRSSPAFSRSRSNGLHTVIHCAGQYAESDQMLYRGVAAYLDAMYPRPA